MLTLQKKIIRIMAGAQPRTSCVSLFKQSEILPVPCQYILSLMSFFINKHEIFKTNSSIHNINTRNKHHHLRQSANLSSFQGSAVFAGLKIFNSLPPRMTILENDKAKLKVAVRKYLHTHSTHSIDGFFICKDD